MGKGECAAVVQGFNVYAGDAIDGRDRKRVERMCRYMARPPIATERLSEAGGALQYELRISRHRDHPFRAIVTTRFAPS